MVFTKSACEKIGQNRRFQKFKVIRFILCIENFKKYHTEKKRTQRIIKNKAIEVHEDNNDVWSNEACLRVLCTKHLSLKLSESRMFRLCRSLYYSHLHDIAIISSHPTSLCDLLYNRTLLYYFILRKKQKTAKKVPKYSFFV